MKDLLAFIAPQGGILPFVSKGKKRAFPILPKGV